MLSPGDPIRRVAGAVSGSIDSAADMPEFQRELLERLRSMDAGIQEVVGAIVPLRDDIALVQRSLGASATDQVGALQASMTRVEGLVRHIDEQVPDPDAPSPIEKAKDALLGTDTDHQHQQEE